MTIAFGTLGTVAAGTTSLAPTCPASVTAGQLLLLFVMNKHPPNGPSTPSGWFLIGQASGGSGASGSDTGSVYCTVYGKIADGTESGTTVTVTITSGNSGVARIARYTKAAGACWEWAFTTGSDNTEGTAYSVTGAGDPGITANDFLVVGTAINTDLYSYTSQVHTVPGCTLGTESVRYAAGTTQGNDTYIMFTDAVISSGTSSGAPTFAATASGTATDNPAGASVFVRLREVVLSGTATCTTTCTGAITGAGVLTPSACSCTTTCLGDIEGVEAEAAEVVSITATGFALALGMGLGIAGCGSGGAVEAEPEFSPLDNPNTVFFADVTANAESYDADITSIANVADVSLTAAITDQSGSFAAPKMHRMRGGAIPWFESSRSEKLATAFSSPVQQPLTIVGVFKALTSGTQYHWDGYGGGSSVLMSLTNGTYPGTKKNLIVNAGVALSAANVIDFFDPTMYAIVLNGANSKIYVAARTGTPVLVASGDAGSLPLDGILVGGRNGANPFRGLQSIPIVVAEACGVGEIQNLADYLDSLYHFSGDTLPTMFAGDSLTRSLGSGNLGAGTLHKLGARKDLYEYFNDGDHMDGRWIEPMGSLGGSDLPTWPGALHDGVSGETIADIRTRIEALIGPGHSYHPALMRLMAGTNDSFASTPAATQIAAFKAMVLSFHSLEPTMGFVLDNQPRYGDAAADAIGVAFNALFDTMCSELEALGVVLTRAYPGSTPYDPQFYYDDGSPDTRHYNDVGYRFEALRERGPFREIAALVP